LLAYLPIFFIIISLLILIFFFAMSSYSRRQTVQANEVFAEHVLQAVDSSLQFTEQMIIKELITDEKLRLFYDAQQELAPFDNFEIARRIKEIASAFPPIKSIYLYRATDHIVLTPNTMVPLEQFGDRDFVEQAMKRSIPYAWTSNREYKEFDGIKFKMKVVSLAKQVPLGSGSQGLLVVNVLSSSIQDMLDSLSDDKVYIHLTDINHKSLYGEPFSFNKQLSKIQSDYTGWIIKSGLKNKTTFNLFSTLSNVWLILGLLTVISGAVWMIYSVRRNYKPIESIKDRIQLYASQTNDITGHKQTGDEFHFISAAIENLIEISNSYEQNYKENLIFRKRWFFDELIEGDRSISIEEWHQEMRRLGLSERFGRIATAVLEIDRYAEFCTSYSHSDQQLLKFSVISVIKEIAQNHSIFIWNEWVSHNQIGILITLTKENANDQFTVCQFCEEIRCWIEDNLRFTITFGIGNIVDSILEASHSYQHALKALQYKTAIGINNTIGYWQVDMLPQGQIYRHLPDIRAMAQHYRLGDGEWKTYLHQMFDQLRTVVAPRDEITTLMNYVIFTIHKEMTSLSAEMSELWEREALHPLNQLLNQFDDMEEFESRFIAILNGIAGSLHLLREKRENHQLIRSVRHYIAEHYANPDLSLNHLSDAFHMNIKSLSRVFKEEFSENFVDYVARVRIEQAKQWLVKTPNETVQDIARKVGYTHSITFIRVFKKLEGITPGDYRKNLLFEVNHL